MPADPNNTATDKTIADIEKIIDRHIDEQKSRAVKISPEYARLWGAMAECHSAGGKRLRPYMAMLAYEAFGGQDYNAMLPVASAAEILHLALLVHDDIIDRDTFRRGRLNIAGQYQKTYSQSPDNQHLATSAAIIAGDLLISSSYQIILGSKFDADKKLAAIELMGDTIFEVCGGELHDFEGVLYSPQEVDSIKVAELKTAGYSFDAPLKLGGLMAGADSESIKTLSEFACSVGIAYQMSDDLIGALGDEAVTGKPSDSDLAEGKRTYLLQRSLINLNDGDRSELEGLIGRQLNNKELSRPRELIISSGGVDEVESLIKTKLSEASRALAKLKFTPSINTKFEILMEKAVERPSINPVTSNRQHQPG